MRKKKYTKPVGVLLSEDVFQILVEITDELEVTLSEYIRDLVEKDLTKNIETTGRN